MRRRRILLFVSSALVLSACIESTTEPGFAPQASRAPSPNISVTTTVYDRDEFGELLLTRSDDQSGSGQASYSAASSGVTSVVFSSGDGWQVYLGNQQVRTLFLVLASQGIPVPDGYYYANVEAFSRCFAADNLTGLSWLQMVAGQAYTNCAFGVDFKYNRIKYKLAMSPKYAGTGRAVVTCTGILDGSCRRWTVRPDSAASAASNLYEYAKNGSLVFKGAYRNTYSVTIER